MEDTKVINKYGKILNSEGKYVCQWWNNGECKWWKNANCGGDENKCLDK